MIYEYKGRIYPEYIRNGNACRFILPMAQQFCHGVGLDIGSGRWPLPGARAIDVIYGPGDDNTFDAMCLPDGPFDYIFSSHCLEHLFDPVGALEHWKSRLKAGGVLFLYLPHPDMVYWRPQWNRKHRHMWWPADMKQLVEDLGFVNVLHSERDLAWGFAVVGFVPSTERKCPKCGWSTSEPPGSYDCPNDHIGSKDGICPLGIDGP